MSSSGVASKDLFSSVSASYAKHRPTYPDELFQFLYKHCPEPRRLAWDVATGSGQAAVRLAEVFPRVVATDLSATQIAHAVGHPRVEYKVTPGRMEEQELHSAVGQPGSVDLVTIAQGYHWFDHEHFPTLARRVVRPGGLVAVWAYSLCRLTPEFNAAMEQYYETTFPYWEPERKFIDEGYKTIPFHFDPLPGVAGTGPFTFTSTLPWTLHDFFGYLSSWSAYATAQQQGVELLDTSARVKFQAVWGDPDEVKAIDFPIKLRIGTPRS